KYDQAVDVVAKKVANDLSLPQIVARAGLGRNYKKALRDKLQHLIFGMGVRAATELSVQRLQYQLSEIEKKIGQLEEILLAREEHEIKNGSFLSNYSGGLFSTIKKFFIERNILNTKSYWDIIQEWEFQVSQRTRWTKKFAKERFHYDLKQAMYAHRPTFLALLDELKQRPKGQRSKFQEVANFELLFKALPIWLCNTREVNQILPMQAEMFDLVIIDEASQCDIASALPILQRGKRAVIVGDPQQLRHLSFLSVKRQRALQHQLGLNQWQGDPMLNYRDNSLLDIVNRKLTNPSQLHFLNEHYRSQPDIIHFSNTYFYQNALNIMTDAPVNKGKQNVHLHICQGRRNASGYNEIEAAALFEKLNEIVQAEADKTQKSSIGILSPFRGQVDYLKKRIGEFYEIGSIQAHQFLIGTPYHFQGEEKDIMLLSMAVDDETHPSTFKYLDRNDVFNVSITRARHEQHVFISSDLKRWSKDLLLVQYLDTIIAQKSYPSATVNHDPIDDFAQEVTGFLKENQIEAIFHEYEIAGFPVDLVIQHGTQTFGIDLVGYPGMLERAFPPERYQMLNRIGIPVFVLPYSQWSVERVLCEDQLLVFLGV
ncbi:MAG: DEAD/DEAH box helicase, partial [Bacteroidota bacterium]